MQFDASRGRGVPWWSWGGALLVVAAMSSSACARGESSAPRPEPTTERASVVRATATPQEIAPAPVAAEGFTFVTTGGAPTAEALPWILALHGLGDRPEAFAGLFARAPFRAHVVLPRGLLDHGAGYDWFGARVSGDPEALARGVERATDALARLLDRLAADERLIGAPIVTGFSQGGILSFALAVRHPERIRASLPIGGWLPHAQWPDEAPARAPPIIAFHGEADAVVPFAPTHELCSELTARGYALTLRSYPGLGHSIDAALRRDWYDALEIALVGKGTQQRGELAGEQRGELAGAEAGGEPRPPRPGPGTQRAGSSREALPAPVSFD